MHFCINDFIINFAFILRPFIHSFILAYTEDTPQTVTIPTITIPTTVTRKLNLSLSKVTILCIYLFVYLVTYSLIRNLYNGLHSI